MKMFVIMAVLAMVSCQNATRPRTTEEKVRPEEISAASEGWDQLRSIEKSERCSSREFLRSAWLKNQNGHEFKVVSLKLDQSEDWIQISNFMFITTEECIKEFAFVE